MVCVRACMCVGGWASTFLGAHRSSEIKEEKHRKTPEPNKQHLALSLQISVVVDLWLKISDEVRIQYSRTSLGTLFPTHSAPTLDTHTWCCRARVLSALGS